MNRQTASAGGEPDSIDFLDFRVDRRGGCLVRAGETIPLRPKTWAVLVHLAQRPGVLVTRDELLDAVWPSVAVTPDTLTKSIGELRLALGDDSRTPRCIETVHRRGFRFIAATRMSGSGSPAPGFGGVELKREDEQREARIFVGREDELERLSACLAKASRGERQIVLVTGPAGVGKTRLVDAFLDSPAVSSGPSPVWIGRAACVEQHATREPYMPVLDALERLAHRPDAKRLRALLRSVAPTWLVQMPWLIGDGAKPVWQSLQAARAERMPREFAALVEALSTDLTVVLVLEDLHWSDAATVYLLTVLAQRREPARLLVIGTYRAAEAVVQHRVLSRAARTLQMRRQCVDLPLHDLSTEEVERYLEERFPGADFAPALARLLHEYTDGNPLLVVAVVENMLSRGWILETAPGWALSTPVQKLQPEMPDDARRMIEMQFDGLSPADRWLLQVASVVGKEFAVQPVAAVLECGVEDAEMRCEALARAHSFLRFAGVSELPDASAAPRYAFTHELYRHAAYAEIPEGRRRRLHQEVGEALEAVYGEGATAVAPELGVHFERSGDYARALVYLAAAAQRARQRFANREAVDYLETALALAASLPDARERQLRELDVRLELGPALSDLHGFASERVRNNYERARRACTEVGTPEQLFRIVYALCYVYAVRSDGTLTPQVTAELDDLATRLGSDAYRLLAGSVLVRVAMEAGRFAEACRLAERRLPAPSDQKAFRLPFAYGPDPLVEAQGHYALALWVLGHTERARTVMGCSLAAARGAGSTFGLLPAMWYTGLLEACGRNPAAALEPANQAVALSTEYGFALWKTLAAAVRGWVAVQSGQISDGIAQLEHARAAHSAMEARLFTTYILTFLAEAHLRAGTLDAGLDAVNEGLAVAESTLDRSYWPEIWRVKGELLLASAPRTGGRGRSRATASDGHWQAAEQCLLRAVQVARETEAKSYELRAATSLARAWHARRRNAEARDVLTEPCEWFGASAHSPDLNEARELLAKLSAAAAV
jgi:DNA-binding winged helix-turn-helix (wHTH) protein/type II secretory pathway predicted ATPase ExeA/tetratricopeptide (TPR) repeat protein